MVLALASRNGLEDKLPFRTVSEAQAAFQYDNLQQFLDLRDASLQVLVTEVDFREVMTSYLTAAAAQNVRHAEVFFDPQVHMLRGIGFDVFMPGFLGAIRERCPALGVSAKLLMCFMTELGPLEAEKTLAQAAPYMNDIVGVGLARGIPNWKGDRWPHSAFAGVFEKCRRMGLRLTAHAGEEGPAEEIWEAINVLHVERIDHGVSCVHDEALMAHLRETRLPLTVCPLSNFKLQVMRGRLLAEMRTLLDARLCVTVNSDDPPFFGGYVNENMAFWAAQLRLEAADIARLARNSVEASFLGAEEKRELNAAVGQAALDFGIEA